MQIEYKSKKIMRICTNANIAQKEYGADMAYLIQQRIQEIESSDNVDMMIRLKIGRCHPLKGNRKGQYVVDLVQPHRLAFSVKHDIIEIVRIEEVIDDYH